MKRALLVLFSLVLLTVVQARADVSVEVFYESLEPHGEWVDIDGYGYGWTPREVHADWRPYTDGSWVYTDAGWTWVSDEPYGWAVYHYGRWLQTESVGWVWIPGEEWGPAWVSWRRSPEYVGWAPLPPEVGFSRSAGISSRIDVEFDIGPSYYSFVPVRSFGAERLRTVIIEPRRNVTIINETRNITNITYVNQTVVNRGPDYEVMSRESKRPIRRLKLNRRTDFAADERTIKGGARISGESLEVPAPRIEKKAKARPKAARKIEKVEVDRGWKNAGSKEEVEKVRSRMKQEESEPEATPKALKEKAAAEDKPAKSEAKEPRARKSQEAATEDTAPARKAAKRPPSKPEAVEKKKVKEKKAESAGKPEKAEKERKKAAPEKRESELAEEPVQRAKKKAAVKATPVEAPVAPPQRQKKVRQQPAPAREAPAQMERKSEPPQRKEVKVRKPKQEKAPRAPEVEAEMVPEEAAEKSKKKQGKDKKKAD